MNERSPTPLDREIGRRIRRQRLSANVSQEQLAKDIGVTFQQVQKYENGTNRIAASRLHRVACALGVEMSAFFDGLRQ